MPAQLSPARLRRILTGSGRLRIYSFQSLAAQVAADDLGYWTGSLDTAVPDYAEAYAWMRGQMAQRLSGYSGEQPVWAYLSRPNMRQQDWDTDRVLIVADVPRERVLLSDYDLWHYVLNQWMICDSEAESDRAEEAGWQTWEPIRESGPEMIASWAKVFDLGERPEPARSYLGRVGSVQACVDRIYPNEIVRISPAPGRRGRNGGQF